MQSIHIVPILAAFANPLLAWAGIGLAGVPVLIHLLNRRRFRRVVWAAMDWLLAAQRQNARRIRIEQLLLLAIRCLIMLLIALAIARPILGAIGLGRLFGQKRTVRLIVLDDSYSMAAGNVEANAFIGARDAAARLVGDFSSDEVVGVVLAGGPARMLIEPTADHQAVLDALAELTPTARGTDLPGAMRLALGVLQKDGMPIGKHVLVIGDRSRSGWTAKPQAQPASGSSGGPQGQPEQADLAAMFQTLAKLPANLSFIDASPQRTENLAVTSLTAERAVIGPDEQIHVSVEIANHGELARDKLKVRLTLDPLASGSQLSQRLIDVPSAPKDKTVRVEDLISFGSAGFHTITAELVEANGQAVQDAVALDNTRTFSMLIRPRVSALLVDGQPGRRSPENELFGLAIALAPLTGAGGSQIEELQQYTLMPEREEVLRRTSDWLRDRDLVVLANVDLLASASADQACKDLAEFVRAGGGLMIFMGNQCDSERALEVYNRLLYADGTGPLPARLVVGVGSPTERLEGERLPDGQFDHPILEEFKGKEDALQSWRFYRHVRAEVPDDSDATVLLRYGDGDPMIVLKKFGDGRVALITTSADSDWNNMYGKSDYLPLFNKLAFHLAPAADVGRNLPVGGELVELLTAEQAAVPGELHPPAMPPTLRGTAGEKAARARQVIAGPREGVAPAAAANIDQRQFASRAGDLLLPGFYTLDAGGAKFVYAVNPPADAESDLTPLDDKGMRAVIGADTPILKIADLSEASQQIIGGSEISRTLLYIVLALCVLESWLAMRFGHFRE